jgi:hypothetical protein
MSDHSNVNIIGVAHADGTNTGINVNLRYGGAVALIEALMALEDTDSNNPPKVTADVLRTLYKFGGYGKLSNVHVTPFFTTHDKAIKFASDNKHTIVTIDAPCRRIFLQERRENGSTHEFLWENIVEAEKVLIDIEVDRRKY